MIKDIGVELGEFFDGYIRLEREMQRLIYPLSQLYCSKCFGKCCSEQICKESRESIFLSMLVARQRIQYDNRNGWIGTSGCRLDYGRPLVCYEFFCEDMTTNSLFSMAHIQKIMNDFISIGENAHGKSHLICLYDLDVLSPKKIKNMSNKVGLLLNKVVKTRFNANS